MEYKRCALPMRKSDSATRLTNCSSQRTRPYTGSRQTDFTSQPTVRGFKRTRTSQGMRCTIRAHVWRSRRRRRTSRSPSPRGSSWAGGQSRTHGQSDRQRLGTRLYRLNIKAGKCITGFECISTCCCLAQAHAFLVSAILWGLKILPY